MHKPPRWAQLGCASPRFERYNLVANRIILPVCAKEALTVIAISPMKYLHTIRTFNLMLRACASSFPCCGYVVALYVKDER